MSAPANYAKNPGMPKFKRVADEDLRRGMIVTLPDEPGAKYEVMDVRGTEKLLLRREDLERV